MVFFLNVSKSNAVLSTDHQAGKSKHEMVKGYLKVNFLCQLNYRQRPGRTKSSEWHPSLVAATYVKLTPRSQNIFFSKGLL